MESPAKAAARMSKMDKGPITYPPDHVPGMKVPKGGSSCLSCSYYIGNNKCGSKYFQKWMKSDVIPFPAAEYCSDWYEPKQ